MADFLFYFFAALTLMAAFMTVISRNLVNGAMFMILSFVGMAGLFVLLGAYFLAVLQVLVYAGAIVVLFLFIIMLLDVSASPQVVPGVVTLAASVAGLALLVSGAFYLFGPGTVEGTFWTLDSVPAMEAKNYGIELFTKYQLPFQIAGFLLLIAMVGVIVLSKKAMAAEKEQKETAVAQAKAEANAEGSAS